MNLNNFDLNLLRVFTAVIKDRNVTAAGARIGLSQPSMSHALNRLRQLCGDPLFVRTTHGMQPTPFALALAAPIEQALETVRNSLERGLGFNPAESTRTFQLLTSDIGATIFLPPLMAHLKTAAPSVTIVANQMLRDDYRDALQAGSIDLALGNVPSLQSGFFQQRLFEDRFVCILRADHPRIPTTRAKLTLKQYLAESHVLVALPGSSESVVERALAQRGLKRRIALQVPHYLVLPMIVAASDLIVTVPGRVSTTFIPRHALRAVAVPFAVPSIRVCQFWHERYHHDPGNRWLRGVLAKMFLAQ